MKVSWNLVFQSLGFILQGVNALANVVPPHYQPAVALVVAGLQGLIAWHAHYYNPDGTPSEVAYIAKK